MATLLPINGKSAIKANLHTSIGSRVDLWSHKTVAIAFGIKAFVWMKFANGEIGQLHNKPHTNIHAYERVGAANDRRQEDLLHCSFEHILLFKHFILLQLLAAVSPIKISKVFFFNLHFISMYVWFSVQYWFSAHNYFAIL